MRHNCLFLPVSSLLARCGDYTVTITHYHLFVRHLFGSSDFTLFCLLFISRAANSKSSVIADINDSLILVTAAAWNFVYVIVETTLESVP